MHLHPDTIAQLSEMRLAELRQEADRWRQAERWQQARRAHADADTRTGGDRRGWAWKLRRSLRIRPSTTRLAA